MTGNMVLLGISAGRLDGELAAHTIAAVAAFVVGCVAGSRLAGRPGPDGATWPRAITRALCVEAAALVAYAVAWWASGSHPESWLALCLLVVNALAMGIQSSAVLRFGVPGLSTTSLTGTLTTLVHRLVSGHRLREVRHSVCLLAALVGGAAAAAVLLRYAPALAPVLQLAALAAVLGLATA